MRKRLVITGVAGFIGRHIALEALERGYRVTGIDRRAWRREGVEFVEADVRDKEKVWRAVQDSDAVVHLAAITSNVEFLANPSECYDINVNGFSSVLDAAAKSGCARVVYASSAAVYGDRFSEATDIVAAKLDNHYAKTKLINEMMGRSYREIYGLGVVGLRYFNVYGYGENAKGNYASIITLLLTAKIRGEKLVLYGDGTQARDLIHVEDVARMSLELLEKGQADLYNVGTGVATEYRKLAEMIDGDNIVCVPNPLTSYQMYTRADVRRLREVVGEYQFSRIEDGVRELEDLVKPEPAGVP
jgi:UDP-glucose 4-epimerase